MDSVPLYEYRLAPTPITDTLVKELLSKENRKRRRTSEQSHTFRTAVSVLTGNANAVMLSNPKCEIALKLGSTTYTNTRYNNLALTYRPLSAAYEGLIKLGYLKQCSKGYHDHNNRSKSRTTRYIGTDKLFSLMSDEDKSSVLLDSFNPTAETIILHEKEEDKRVKLPYTDTAETNLYRENLLKINTVLHRNWYDLELPDEEFRALAKHIHNDPERPPIDLSRRTLRRVFTDGRFDSGGRFYGGWWQHVPKEYRPFIIINGKKTVEYDYDQINPTMIYAFADETYTGDAYDIGLDIKYRPIIKEAFNAMLQSATPLKQKPRKLNLKDIGLKWSELRSRILERHAPVKDQFFCARGNKLQFLDSQIAEKILLYFADQNIPCLSIHDSFIMHHGYEKELKALMDSSFKDFLSKECGSSAEDRKPPYYIEEDVMKPIDTNLAALLANLQAHELRLNAYFSWRYRKQS